ncbi:glycoside hydrolase N-terminal domain-containing protein [Actinoplanes sp. NEAU-A12]|uniref:Glycoside hydrolase N-terminal domain-containing protein n=1 Tax=Actinoplanes sandaracinus TaxID=3045177 RepID=A0ABT6WQC4_9ACTN|nr:glycoside hydrolase N-terminal domain-containing protein [Actinoplanes sandaracinus]MDI6101937.1 glycoside hydrolase N-terminal domain-containing protein [Actinoplanes sandaracinus]
MQSNVNPSFHDAEATDDWERALISGNGRQGALCYGSPSALRFTLAHEDLFQPVTEPLPAPHTAPALPRLREFLDTDRFHDAARAVCDLAAEEHPGYAETRWIDPLIGAGTLTFTPDPPGDPGSYRRGTDFTTGVVRQEWAGVTADAFVSRPADVLVVRITGTGGTVRIGGIDGDPEQPIAYDVDRIGDDLVLTGRFGGARWAGAPDGWTVAVRVRRTGASVLIVARTVTGLRPPAEALAALPEAGFDALLEEHTAVHRDLYQRVGLDLGGHPAQRLFDAGRYAIISSSGARPPTLQGVWSGTYAPPWRSGWTIDGNLQAALLAVHATGTPELMPPLFDLLDTMRDDFRENALRLYGVPGLYAPAHLGTHGRQNHFGPVWCLTFWTAGAAWLARLYLEHWQHTGDRSFLASRALPFLREAAEFHLAFTEIHDGRARFSPSYSPENDPGGAGEQAAVDSTLDVQAVAALLRGLLTITEVLGLDDPDALRWRGLLAALPSYRVNDAGELAEWIDPRFGDNHEHRHSSHLYPFLYGGDPAFEENPALRAAAVRAVRSRLRWWLSEASDEMGYGLALLGVAAANLGLAEEAYAALTRLTEAYWRPNLVPTHNRDHMFNVDVAGGFPALVVAMLLRSRDTGPDGVAHLDLLPALPSAWPSGSVRGLVARGPVTVDLTWTPDRLEATLLSPVDRTVHVGLPAGGAETIALRAGHPLKIKTG